MAGAPQMNPQRESGPLRGVRVIDLGTMIAGPVAGTLMADFGAEVIKIEQPGIGDTMRALGPFHEGESLYWNVDARNKKSVTIDLHKPEGQALLLKLVEKADVLLENFRPGTMEKWNIAYDKLAQVNPGLVMLSVSGFGQTGPYASRVAYDRIGMAFGGVMNLTGFADRPPIRTGISVADYSTAAMGAFAVMMALYHRDACGGKGQHIDLALYETPYRFTEALTSAYDQLGIVRQRRGNIHTAAAPGDHFETSDGRYLILTVSGDAIFERLCRAMGRPEVAANPDYATHEKRWNHIATLNGMVADWVRTTDVKEVTRLLEEHVVPFSIALTIEDIFQDPHYAARGNIASVKHPRLGTLRMQGVIPRMSGTPAGEIQAAPTLGEHTREVLQGLLDLADDQIDALASQGIV